MSEWFINFNQHPNEHLLWLGVYKSLFQATLGTVSRVQISLQQKVLAASVASVSTVIPEYHLCFVASICTASLINCFTSRRCNKSYGMKMVMMMGSYKTNTDAIQRLQHQMTPPRGWGCTGHLKTHHSYFSQPSKIAPQHKENKRFSPYLFHGARVLCGY